MKKILLTSALFTFLFSCEKPTKNTEVVGKNEQGQELVVTEDGDTIVNTNETIIDSLKSGDVIVNNFAIQQNDDNSYKFKYNLEVGKTYPLSLTTKVTNSASDGKESMKISNENKRNISYTVKEFKDGIYTLEVLSKQYSEKLTDPSGNSVSYDTNASKPSNKDAAFSWSIYKAMVNKPYIIKVDQKGKVVSVENLDKIRTQIESAVKNQLNAEEQKFVSELLKNSLSKEAISAQFEETMNIFPDKNLKIKESWSDSQKINEGGLKGNVNLTRTLTSVEPTNTKIVVKGSQNISGSETPQEGVKMSANGNADVNGTILIDTKSGWINNVSLTKKETLKRTIEANGEKQTVTETATTITKVN